MAQNLFLTGSGEKTDLGFLKCVVTNADIREFNSQRVFNKHRISSIKLSVIKV